MAFVFIAILLEVLPGMGLAVGVKETVKIAKKDGFGSFLTDSRGKTLYYFKKDSPGKSACYGDCADAWPPYCYSTSEMAVPEGFNSSDFSSFRRTDDAHGPDHLMYKGRPLYRYSGDQEPGDTNGHGINDVWFVVKP